MNQRMKKKWILAKIDDKAVQQLMLKGQMSRIVATLMVKRGIIDWEEAEQFLSVSEKQFLSPFTMKGMTQAVDRIEKAIEDREKIVVYGDYDVDGITATSLLHRFLVSIGGDVSYYIPERQSEGYGLNLEAVEKLVADGAELIITVDCGISSYDIVEAMKERVDMIITDHHMPPEEVPPALAVVNPKQKDCPYGDKLLAGAGVAFKLCQALWLRKTGQWYNSDLDIAALGTIADVVPLVGENRLIAKFGLQKMMDQPNLGIKELIKVSGLEGRKITAGNVGFSLAPRLNAAGRVTHATEGVKLLISETMESAECLAQTLHETNIERQQIERTICEAARNEALLQGDMASHVLVIAGEGWHSGVIGIVASRLVEEFYKPAIMISISDGIGKASCRSIEGLDMYEALKYCEDLLLQYGGHKQAAGFSIEVDKIDALRIRLTEYCKQRLTEDDYIQTLRIDSFVEAGEITIPLITDLAKLEPFGMGNSTPVFAIENMVVENAFIMGQQKNHIKFLLKKDDQVLEAISWNGSHYHAEFFKGDIVKIAFTLQTNEWQGELVPQLIIQDLQRMNEVTPRLTKEGLRELYPVVKSVFRNPERMRYIVESEVIQQSPVGLTPLEAMLGLEVFKELGIIKEITTDKGTEYHWCSTMGKLDLVMSLTYLKYSE